MIEKENTKEEFFKKINTLFDIPENEKGQKVIIMQKYDEEWEDWVDVSFSDLQDKDKIKVFISASHSQQVVEIA